MVRRTRQMGVPVIADEQEAIVGFDRPMARMAVDIAARRSGCGLRRHDGKDGPGRGAGLRW